jgi:UDP-2,3-diacylglucosamine pyrophosphatase LpxH
MRDDTFASALLDQMRWAPGIILDPSSRIVVISDLHMGDGSGNDDLRRNGELLGSVLEKYYFDRGFTLLLNGDIEDLQKFRLAKIRAAWRGLFAVFDRFAREGRLYKIYGNHDEGLLEEARYPYTLHTGVRLGWGPRTLYVFHGHQASSFLVKHNDLSGAIVRYVLHTLRIRNRSPSEDSVRRYRVERRIYAFSRLRGVVSIIGHTHRPLFESLSKYDRLRFEIERLCAEYSLSGGERKAEIADTVELYKEEFLRMGRKERRQGRSRSLYGSELLLPCLFNSGCAVGKKGLTSIEIEGGRIALAYWCEEGKEKRYLEREAGPAERLGEGPFIRARVGNQALDGVFARMDLLS